MKCIEWINDNNNIYIKLIDQTKLPGSLEFITCGDVETLGNAIKRLAVRGAPALGIAAAMGIALVSVKSGARSTGDLISEIREAGRYIASTRPTAVNLFWAIERMMKKAREITGSVEDLKNAMVAEALEIAREDEATCRAIGDNGAEIVKEGWNIIHHCNTGFLATGDYGTALGVIRSAHNQGKKIHVWVDETRPLLQGARLTAWELEQDGIPYTLIADNMAGYLMKQNKVDMAVVGADRITASGDFANKIGTYSLAVLAKYHGVPFYTAAPFSTIDINIPDGDKIPIEMRSSDEVTSFHGVRTAPEGAAAYNPSFDVTPHELISGIITEKGIIRPPYKENIEKLYGNRQHGRDI